MYHSHCLFCDGRADMEVFVRFAISRGFASYGFSSHAPLPFSTGWSMEWDRMDDYLGEFARLKEIREELEALGGDESARAMRLDILDYQIREISEAELVEGEEESLAQEREKLANAEKILQSLSVARDCLNGEGGVLDVLQTACRNVGALSPDASTVYVPGIISPPRTAVYVSPRARMTSPSACETLMSPPLTTASSAEYRTP